MTGKLLDRHLITCPMRPVKRFRVTCKKFHMRMKAKRYADLKSISKVAVEAAKAHVSYNVIARHLHVRLSCTSLRARVGARCIFRIDGAIRTLFSADSFKSKTNPLERTVILDGCSQKLYENTFCVNSMLDSRPRRCTLLTSA